LPAHLANEYNISVIPAILIIDGKSYEDGGDISRQEFYEKLPKMDRSPSTAAPSSGRFQECYERLINSGADKIISIHVSGKLSGILNSAQAAAQSFGDIVKIIDSGQVTMGLGYQVLEAAQAALQNVSVEAILNRVESIRRRVKLVALLDTLEYVRRSGRVSWTRASISSLLQIKPLLGVTDGEVHRLGEVRTRTKGINRLLEYFVETAPYEQLTILHTNAEPDAENIVNEVLPYIPFSPLIVNVTTVIGTHVGPNGLGFVGIRNA
jgi:DegV family protein with EDD domain